MSLSVVATVLCEKHENHTGNFLAGIYLSKLTIETLEQDVKYVQS